MTPRSQPHRRPTRDLVDNLDLAAAAALISAPFALVLINIPLGLTLAGATATYGAIRYLTER